jgi:hypothetical protein
VRGFLESLRREDFRWADLVQEPERGEGGNHLNYILSREESRSIATPGPPEKVIPVPLEYQRYGIWEECREQSKWLPLTSRRETAKWRTVANGTIYRMINSDQFSEA